MKNKNKYMCHNHPPKKTLKNYTKWYNQKLNNSKGKQERGNRRKKIRGKIQKTNSKTAALNPNISIILLNVVI